MKSKFEQLRAVLTQEEWDNFLANQYLPESLFDDQTINIIISSSFNWERSPQGHAYWEAIYERVRNNPPVPAIPQPKTYSIEDVRIDADRSRFREQKQAFFHRPKEGQYGDCHRTAIACVLGVDRDSIPNWGVYVETPDLFEQEAKKYLATQGLRSISFPMWAGEEKGPEAVLSWFGTRNPGVTYLLTGKSRNGTNHVVVCKDKEIIWDTAIDNSGIVAPIENGWYEIELLMPLGESKS